MSVAWNLQPWMEDATVAGSAGCVKGGGELELELCSGWNWIQQGTRSRTVFFFSRRVGIGLAGCRGLGLLQVGPGPMLGVTKWLFTMYFIS